MYTSDNFTVKLYKVLNSTKIWLIYSSRNDPKDVVLKLL